MRPFRHVTVLAGAGVGGGSLIYANTLPIPKRGFFASPAWAQPRRLGARARAALPDRAPHARRAADDVHDARPTRCCRRSRANDGTPPHSKSRTSRCSSASRARPCPTRTSAAKGPERTGCIRCGACMTGCRHGAKNTLDKNYLYLARKRGLDAARRHRGRARRAAARRRLPHPTRGAVARTLRPHRGRVRRAQA